MFMMMLRVSYGVTYPGTKKLITREDGVENDSEFSNITEGSLTGRNIPVLKRIIYPTGGISEYNYIVNGSDTRRHYWSGISGYNAFLKENEDGKIVLVELIEELDLSQRCVSKYNVKVIANKKYLESDPYNEYSVTGYSYSTEKVENEEGKEIIRRITTVKGPEGEITELYFEGGLNTEIRRLENDAVFEKEVMKYDDTLKVVTL